MVCQTTANALRYRLAAHDQSGFQCLNATAKREVHTALQAVTCVSDPVQTYPVRVCINNSP